MKKFLYVCGLLSSLLYAAMLIFIPLQWEGYNSANQTVSELSAIGAPTRLVWSVLGAVYSVLFYAFAVGVWREAAGNRSLRIAGILLVAYGLVSVTWFAAPMQLRGAEFALTDAMHITLSVVTVVLMMAAIGFGAMALGRRFRRYSFVTLATFVVFGTLTGIEAPRIAENLATPTIGIYERINIGAFMLWIAVLSVKLLSKAKAGRTIRDTTSKRGRTRHRSRRAPTGMHAG